MKKIKLLPALLSAAMVFSLAAVPTFAEKAPGAFGDMEGHWSAEAVERWSEAGILHGDENGNFLPDKEMTRAEFAQMLVNLMGYPDKAENRYADVPADAWYADAVLKLTAAGIMEGDGSNAMPDASISREQAAVLLCRALSLGPSADAKIPFDDAGQVSDWAKEAVAALSERAMIAGVGENSFAPAQNINRASVAQMVSNMVSDYVTENGAVLTGERKGVVIIAARDVKVENADLAEPLILAPKAAGAAVTLAGETHAAQVILAARGGKLSLEKEASAQAVTVEAHEVELAVAQGGSINVPNLPQHGEYFYTGKWTYTLEGDTAVYEAQSGDALENVAADLLLIPQAYEVKQAAPAELTYTCEDDTLLITVEGEDTLVMNTYEVSADAVRVEVGIEYTQPEGAAKLATADTLEGLGAAQSAAPEAQTFFVPFGKEGTLTRYLLWTDEQGKILEVNRVTVRLTVDPEKPKDM